MNWRMCAPIRPWRMSIDTRLYWLQRIESCNMDMLTRDSRRHDQFDALGLYGVFQGAKSKQTRKPGNVAAKNGLKAAIVLDRNGTPLLSVGGKHQKSNVRAQSEARTWASPSSSPRNKQVRRKKRRPASASVRSSSHLQKALALS